MKLRTWLQCYGVAALLFFPFYFGIIDRPGTVRMHAPAPVAALVLALIANLVFVSVGLLLVVKCFQGRSIWTPVKQIGPALVLASLAEMIYVGRFGWISTRLWIGVAIVVFVLTFVFRRLWMQGERALFQLSTAVLIGLGLFGIFSSLQLLYLATWSPLPNSTSKTTETIDSVNHPRTVWILFDGLSYEQVFGDRYPNLQLPVFDKFRESSTLFTDVQPVVNETAKAVPSLILGEDIKSVSYARSNKLRIGGAPNTLRSFKAAETPFAIAQEGGLTTGVVGWYNPYCGILAPYLNQCYWTDALQESAASPMKAFWQHLSRPWVVYSNLLGHPRRLLSKTYRARMYQNLLQPPDIGKMLNAEDRVHIYHNLMHHAVHALQMGGPDFVLIHLPVPHPPGFYDRETGKFDTSGDASYVDNLALTDRTLGRLLSILQQSPRWKDTNVIINGDHSWRTYMWAGGMLWTPEDEAASHGRVFDPRPMLMVHLAGQTTAATVKDPFPLLKLHDILDSLAKGQQPAFASTGKPTNTVASMTP